MSVLIKRTDSSSGGGVKGYPPGNIILIDESAKSGGIYLDINGININWRDPQDIIIGNQTLAKWYSTTLVRKEGSVPTSINDGYKAYESTEWKNDALKEIMSHHVPYMNITITEFKYTLDTKTVISNDECKVIKRRYDQ